MQVIKIRHSKRNPSFEEVSFYSNSTTTKCYSTTKF